MDYAAEAAGFGAVYLEGIFSPGERVQRGLRWDDIFSGYADGAVEAEERYGVTVRFTPDLYRGLDPDLAEEAARVSVRYRDRGVVGLGLGGMESGMPAEPYRKAFEIARDGGLGVVPHAGEAGGPESIREILSMDPDRIRHGIRAVEDPAVLAEIVDRRARARRVPDLQPAHRRRRQRSASIRCPRCARPASTAPSTPTTRRCSARTSGRSTSWRPVLGVTAQEAFRAGVAGALCDDATRARLAEIGRAAFG